MSLSRRTLLRAAALAGVAPLARGLVACDSDTEEAVPDYVYDGPLGPESLFSDGVASGDPLPDAVVLWTRVRPADGATTPVFWEVATDAGFTRRIGAGEVETDASRDHTVKIDVSGLDADRTYYYRFQSLGRVSPVGRTRTAPRGDAERLRFVVCSCSSYIRGHYAGYRHIAARDDLSGVIHLGDYIYEYGARPGEVRAHDPPTECLTLDDYRRRYAQYRSDPDLRAAHAQHPFICVWDDHEIVNNAWRGGSDDHDESAIAWESRKAAAVQAWSEWIPARLDVPDRPERIFRRLTFGDLLDLILLDSRLIGRDVQVDPTDYDGLASVDRSLLGAEQEAWFVTQLEASRARWRVLGQQVMMGQFRLTPPSPDPAIVPNPDQWDGYQAARNRLYAALRASGERNVVVLTGDFHSSWCYDLVEDPLDASLYDPANGVYGVGVEFLVPGLTNGIGDVADILGPALYDNNPHLRWVDFENRGYAVLDVTRDRVQAAWFHLADHTDPDSAEAFAAAWRVDHGVPHTVEDDAPA